MTPSSFSDYQVRFPNSARIVVLGIARDCEEAIPSVLSFCDEMSVAFADAQFVIVENDSIDTTRLLIESWQAGRNDCTILSPAYPIAHLRRTERLAACRNLALAFVKRHFAHFDLLIVLDMDLRIHSLSIQALLAAVDFLNSKAETIGVFANSEPVYYDIWALRHPSWCPEDCWREIRLHNKENTALAVATFVHSRQLRIARDSQPICVDSAFNGLGIYRLARVLTGRYCGVDLSGHETCEHVTFHKNIAIGKERRFFIFPSLAVDAPVEHISAAFQPKPVATIDQGTYIPITEPSSQVATMQNWSIKNQLYKKFWHFGRTSRTSKPQQNIDDETNTDCMAKSPNGNAEINASHDHTIMYNIGSHVIELPPDHNLPVFQKEHRLYDRFLPVLAGSLPKRSDQAIVDVGANVGDTATSMLDFCTQKFLCVEGYLRYFDILRSNVGNHLPDQDRFILLNEVVGTGDYKGNLLGNGSTAMLDLQAHGQTARSLDAIVAEYQLIDKVALLKIDTDGFDGDVLLSGSDILKCSEPIIFWENQFADDRQLKTLESSYDLLLRHGYNKLWIFDNFGNLLLEECTFASLHALNNYISAQDRYGCTRTIYYTDVLASKDCYQSVIAEAIGRYKRDVIIN